LALLDAGPSCPSIIDNHRDDRADASLTMPQRAVSLSVAVIHDCYAMRDKTDVVIVVGIVLPIIVLLFIAWHYVF
jgi:hypothetical protein